MRSTVRLGPCLACRSWALGILALAMDLFERFRVILRRRWAILIASLAVAGLVFGFSLTRPKVYQAKALISVTSGRAAGESVTQQATVFLTRSYAELAETRPVLLDAVTRSGASLSAAEARRRITVTAADDVGFLTIAAEGRSPAAATALAQGAADALLASVAEERARSLADAVGPLEAEIRGLEAELAALPAGAARTPLEVRYEALVRAATERRLAPADRLSVVSAARAEPDPVSPRPVRNALLAFMAAIVVNAEAVIVIEAVTDRFHTRESDERVSQVVGLPVLARVPVGETEATLEAFRRLRTNLVFMQTTAPIRTIAMVSTNPGAGKTFSAVHLALAMASLDVPVALIDADLRRPSIHRATGLDRAPGLGDVLAGAPLEAVLQPHPENERLSVIAGGTGLRDEAGVLASSQFPEFLRRLGWASMVVVDTPASQVFADALAIASHCDATLLVVNARGSKRRPVRAMVSQLQQVGANPIGVVLNRTHTGDRVEYYYYRYARRDREPAPTPNR